RARRQKFEKIYGDDANHIKLQQKDKKSKTAAAKNDKDQYDQKTPKSDADADKLHPSWEAKRKQKEVMNLAKNVKGTKIVFD
ncbi:hypothetical protein EV175_007316, partial [Coemansia sp. RSA 1933]